MYYIAYGSNLHKQQMARRCPGSVPVGKGYLEGWELVYRGSKSGSYATLIRNPKKKTPIGIWKINRKNELNLDRYEGYPVFYQKYDVLFTLDDKEVEGMIYLMRPDAKVGRPSDLYVRTLRQGYADFGFNIKYLSESLRTNSRELSDAGL